MGMDTITTPLKLRPAAALAAVVILAALALALASAGDGRALDAAAAWSAPRPLDVPNARALLPFVVGAPSRENCDAAYPTVCIPPPPPDLDCSQVLPLVNFRVLPPDPHHLDADKDGIACEHP